MPNPSASRTAKIVLVGDRSPHVRAHARIPAVLESLRQHEGYALDAYWLGTRDVAANPVDRFDGVWLLPGSPYRSEDGALRAVQTAREAGIPFLGTCAGLQHALLEFARNVCGLGAASHAESTPDGDQPVIVPLSCSLVGHEGAVTVAPDSVAGRALGAGRTVERYHCAYGLNPDYLEVLRAYGMRFTGHDDDGDVRIAELGGHPFFLATLFQPELADQDARCHPIIRTFATAAADHAAGRAALARG
jgi:CTP synthase (UTP-ammonia lyase)